MQNNHICGQLWRSHTDLGRAVGIQRAAAGGPAVGAHHLIGVDVTGATAAGSIPWVRRATSTIPTASTGGRAVTGSAITPSLTEGPVARGGVPVSNTATGLCAAATISRSGRLPGRTRQGAVLPVIVPAAAIPSGWRKSEIT